MVVDELHSSKPHKISDKAPESSTRQREGLSSELTAIGHRIFRTPNLAGVVIYAVCSDGL